MEGNKIYWGLTFSPSLIYRLMRHMFCNVEETVKVRCKSEMINAKSIDWENELISTLLIWE